MSLCQEHASVVIYEKPEKLWGNSEREALPFLKEITIKMGTQDAEA